MRGFLPAVVFSSSSVTGPFANRCRANLSRWTLTPGEMEDELVAEWWPQLASSWRFEGSSHASRAQGVSF